MEVVLRPESHNIIDYIWSSHRTPWFSDCGDIISSSRTRDSILVVLKLDKAKMRISENILKDGVVATVFDADGIPFIADLIPNNMIEEEKIIIGIRNHG